MPWETQRRICTKLWMHPAWNNGQTLLIKLCDKIILAWQRLNLKHCLRRSNPRSEIFLGLAQRKNGPPLTTSKKCTSDMLLGQ